MALPLLIVKTGTTVPSLQAAGEDFEGWIVSGSGLPATRFVTAAVYQGESLQSPADFAGIIVTGSPAFVTEREPWSEQAAQFLARAVAAEIPVLGICYGHQLLAHCLGGEVDFHPGGREIGTVDISLSEAGHKDPVLRGLSATFAAQVSHSQTVTRLPPGGVLLAHNDFEPHHAFRVGNRAWGIQFHPEFSSRVMRAYITDRREKLLGESLDPHRLLQAVGETPLAASVLSNFTRLVVEESL